MFIVHVLFMVMICGDGWQLMAGHFRCRKIVAITATLITIQYLQLYPSDNLARPMPNLTPVAPHVKPLFLTRAKFGPGQSIPFLCTENKAASFNIIKVMETSLHVKNCGVGG